MLKALTATTAAVIILTGCTSMSHDQSPSQTYRPQGASHQITITGDLSNTFKDQLFETKVQRELTVKADGAQIIKGYLGANATGRIDGEYNGERVEADCTSRRVSANWIDIRCTIFINNERAATLTF